MFDFVLRIHKGDTSTSLNDMTDITISNITLIKKRYKHETPFIVEFNKNKFNFNITIKGKFEKFGGSHSYPRITFKDNYIDIEVKNFPRYPAFTQVTHVARNVINGYSHNHINKGYPIYLLYRKIEIINFKTT